MKKEMLKVIGLNLTFLMCCLKKLAWHKRCWHSESPGEVPQGCADNTNFHLSNGIPRADLDVDEHIELLCAGLQSSHWEGCAHFCVGEVPPVCLEVLFSPLVQSRDLQTTGRAQLGRDFTVSALTPAALFFSTPTTLS